MVYDYGGYNNDNNSNNNGGISRLAITDLDWTALEVEKEDKREMEG